MQVKINNVNNLSIISSFLLHSNWLQMFDWLFSGGFLQDTRKICGIIRQHHLGLGGLSTQHSAPQSRDWESVDSGYDSSSQWVCGVPCSTLHHGGCSWWTRGTINDLRGNGYLGISAMHWGKIRMVQSRLIFALWECTNLAFYRKNYRCTQLPFSNFSWNQTLNVEHNYIYIISPGHTLA